MFLGPGFRLDRPSTPDFCEWEVGTVGVTNADGNGNFENLKGLDMDYGLFAKNWSSPVLQKPRLVHEPTGDSRS